METRVLVAYASKYGATAEIAEAIGKGLREAGVPVDVKPARQARDLAVYSAVVLGSGVYMGRWRKDAAKFLKDNELTLGRKELWFFSSGPTAEGDPVEALNGWRLPSPQQAIADRVKPRDITVFGGAVDPTKLSGFERWVLKNVKAPSGDFRDWDAIAAWTASIVSEVKGAA